MEKKVGRNDPCPCGSGKKYKQCHGAETKKTTYTPAGKRKFTAKVIDVTGKSSSVFQNVGTPPPMPSSSEPYELLRFKKTGSDFQVKEEEEKPASFPFNIPTHEEAKPETPSFQGGAPELPPDVFETAQEDFRVEKKEEE